MALRPIRVLVVDDSAIVRKLVADALRTDPQIEVVGTAIDPYVARDKIARFHPDVLTLDIEMPRMDGLTFLKILMEQQPMPVILLSAQTQRGSQSALDALRLGAFDVLAKPGGSYSVTELAAQLIERIKATRGARIRRRRSQPVVAPPLASVALRPVAPRDVILLGASTGGTEALRAVLTRLPLGLPGIAVVQHIPPMFSRTFSARLNEASTIAVREAADGEPLTPGVALIAPGNFHLVLQWAKDHYQVRVTDGPAVWHQRPCIDLLFKSVTDAGGGPQAVAGLLTGMGRDGAEGMLRLRQAGATTFAQDEASSVVYGMPRAAWETGAAQCQLPLDHIADHLIRHYEIPNPATPLALTPP